MNADRSPTTRKRKADVLAENMILRAALKECSAGFTIKKAHEEAINFEHMAREFYRRMKLASAVLAGATP